MSFSLVSLSSSSSNPTVGVPPSSSHPQTHFFRLTNSHFFFLNNNNSRSLPTNVLLTAPTTCSFTPCLQPIQFASSHPYSCSLFHSMSSNSRIRVSSCGAGSVNGDSYDFVETTTGATDAETDSDADDEAQVAITDHLVHNDCSPSSSPDRWDVLGLGQAMVIPFNFPASPDSGSGPFSFLVPHVFPSSSVYFLLHVQLHIYVFRYICTLCLLSNKLLYDAINYHCSERMCLQNDTHPLAASYFMPI